MKSVLSLVITLAMLAVCLTPAIAEASFTPGTYSATVPGNNGDVTVSVTVTEDAITDVTIGENNETMHIMNEVQAAIPQAILDSQSLAVDALSGATITSRAVLSAAAKCIEQAGGDTAALSEKPAVEATEEVIDTDVVVVGAGIAGLTAANKLLSEGVSVVLIEQLDIIGGTTRFAGGSMFGTLDPEATSDWLLERYGVSGRRTGEKYPNMEKLERMVEVMPDTFDFYRSLGFNLDYEKPEEINRVVVRDDSIGDVLKEGGYIWAKSLVDAYESRGGKLLLGTKATALRQEDGAIVGVDAETKTGTLTINAKYTIMATGSAVGSRELMAEFCPTKADGEIYQSSVGSTGEGIAMLLDLGAVPFEDWDAGLGLPCTFPVYARSNRDYLSPFANDGALFVGYDGVREAKEWTGKLFTGVYQIVGKPDAFFTILDAPTAEKLGLTEALADGLSWNTTHFFQADTLEALAEAAGFDTETFLATVEDYNGYCEAGEDLVFGKDADKLSAISEAPFYAVKNELAHLDVVGGVQTSNDFEVITESGETVPGIYAVGNVTGRDLMGNAGGSAFSVAAYTSLTACESILSKLN